MKLCHIIIMILIVISIGILFIVVEVNSVDCSFEKCENICSSYNHKIDGISPSGECSCYDDEYRVYQYKIKTGCESR